MDEILWHRRESRRLTEKTNFVLQSWESPAYSKRQEKENTGPTRKVPTKIYF